MAGALERKVWVHTLGSNLYPNLYVVLCAPPGIGKTVLTSLIQNLFAEMNDHHLAPSSVSRASLVDALREANRKLIKPTQTPSIVDFNSLMIIANEMGVLVPGYDNEFMNTLTDLYDGKRYAEKKRGKDLSYVMKHPQLNLLAATTPSYLNSVMPEGAWDQGFISRVVLVFSGEQIIKSLFTEDNMPESSFNALAHDLKIIGDLFGKIKFTHEAAAAIDKWNMLKGPPRPEHPKLLHYNTRRTAHLLKLSMIACVACRDELVVTIDDFNTALSWLLEAEIYMPDIFKSMASGGDARAIEDTYYYAYQVYTKEKAPVSEARIIEYLQNRVPAHSVERVLQVMIKSKLLEKQLDGYRPRARRDV